MFNPRYKDYIYTIIGFAPISIIAGAAYNYEDETSSDSDDEVLKRFKLSKEATEAVKRSNSKYSHKDLGSPSGVPTSTSGYSMVSNRSYGKS